MRYRKLTGDGDYTFGGSALDFYRDVPEAVGQSVETRLELWLGEWFLNTDDGTPYVQGVLGKKTKDAADQVIQYRVSTTTGVTDITDYNSVINPDTRKLSVSFSINTIYGPTAVDIANYADY